MRCVRVVVPMLLTLSTLACSSISVTSDYDVTVNFDALHTYNWAPEPEHERDDPRTVDPRLNNSLVDGRVRRAVDYELSQRGYQKELDGAVDFWVTYHVGMDRKLNVTTVQSHAGYYRGYRDWGGYSETHLREYEEGTLLIDVVDPESGSLIWRGTAQAPVSELRTPEERTARIDMIVAAVLAKFPPEARNREP